MRRKLVVGNWKMHGGTAANQALLEAIKAGAGQADLVVCVPFPYLPQAQKALQGSAVAWGAQDVSQYDKGAYTGEVSVSMLKDFGCGYAIVGHSERRTLHGETDGLVAAKALATLQGGLCPIICVGETLAERDTGRTEEVVCRQMHAILNGIGVAELGRAVVAYEPVWAIGTGRTATPQQAQEVHAMLRGCAAAVDMALAAELRILYGGSVKAANAQELFAQPDVDGGLVGGASLVAEEFLAIGAAV